MTETQSTTALHLDDPLSALVGVGPKRTQALADADIHTLRDLILYFPRKYNDRRAVTPIAELIEDEEQTIFAEVTKIRSQRLRGRQTLAVGTLRDATGEINVTWFGQGYLANSMPIGTWGYFSGVVGQYKGLCFKSPEYELMRDEEDKALGANRIAPIYPLFEGITQRMLRGWIAEALAHAAHELKSTVAPELEARHAFPPIGEAIRDVHFPATPEAAKAARRRFAYEELLSLQIKLLTERRARIQARDGIAHRPGGPTFKALRESLPFALTGAQERAIGSIVEDMAVPAPMFRLLQGDVGCGKTIAAAHAIATACDGGFQAAIMAPTAILAEQHATTLRASLGAIGLQVGLLTAATEDAHEVRAETEAGRIDVLVGTHALIQDKTTFANLGLIIVDEQHRFGVVQREALARKGNKPDILQMTATPIPRTLAHTVYGAMDLTLIDELPPGRVPVKTRRITPAKEADMHSYIAKQCRDGGQAYYVCPLVEDSEKFDLASVTRIYEERSSEEYADLRTALIHGRMPAIEKEQVMTEFKAGTIDILFATSVIEVGVDVPAANIMVIEDAGRFGLTQLHQLRGRVGRGGGEAFCFLLGKPRTTDGKKRLQAICATTDGFALAETDLELRGPGEFHGVRQAGLSDLRFADLLSDARLLDQARRDAQRLVDTAQEWA